MKPVEVLTAGGAGNAVGTTPSRKRQNKKRRNRNGKKKPPASPSASDAPLSVGKENTDGDLLGFAQPPAANHRSDSLVTENISQSLLHTGSASNGPQKDLLAALEIENSESQHGVEEPVMVPLLQNEQNGRAATKFDSSVSLPDTADNNNSNNNNNSIQLAPSMDENTILSSRADDDKEPPSKSSDMFWLVFCFFGIMASFVCYGLLLEYTTSGGRKLHELSFLFVTSSLYTVTAAFGRYVRAETPTTIPPARFAVLGITSMGSTFCSVRSLRYVIYPIQVLAKSCKPVPVMIFGAVMGKKYALQKYINVCLIVLGVALFMGGGENDKKAKQSAKVMEEQDSSSQIFGVILLFISLCFDGGTGAYEDKLMSVHSVQPFDLMYNIQLGKTILAGIALLVLNQLHIFLQMCQDMGFMLVALGISGALGQVFIFVTIAKFGALTCSIIGLARKVTTLVASIYFYGHHLNGIQFTGLTIAVGAMVMNFMGKKAAKSSKNKTPESSLAKPLAGLDEEMQRLNAPEGEWKDDIGHRYAAEDGHVEMSTTSKSVP